MASSEQHESSPATRLALRVWQTRGLDRRQLEQMLVAHRTALATGRGVLKRDARTAVTRVPCRDAWACVKEYRRSGPLDLLKELLRGSRARRAWRGAALLARKGVSAPEALAAFRHGTSAFLVTRYVEGAVPLNRLIAERFAGALSADQLQAKRRLLRQLAAWLRRVHDLGIYHDDWSAKNFLAAEQPDGWVFYLLDFESLSARKPLTRRRRAKNLAQLADLPHGVTRADKMRFLVAYAAGDRTRTRGRFPREILRLGRQRVAARQRRRRGQPS
ncbi:MAG TPA: lipopolysaccharide kinase InaA family protein [Planctomycetota bacterium]|nr:lipopolysaccharide kinase InaA family protein [Planctomycetota bacterium]HRR79350.1 lipopolysaccharide kinase InaA family protein [Planctomycetota bacterium]